MKHITFGVCIAADSTSLLPLLILPHENQPPLTEAVMTVFAISGSAKGWMTTKIFCEWIINTFIPQITW